MCIYWRSLRCNCQPSTDVGKHGFCELTWSSSKKMKHIHFVQQVSCFDSLHSERKCAHVWMQMQSTCQCISNLQPHIMRICYSTVTHTKSYKKYRNTKHWNDEQINGYKQRQKVTGVSTDDLLETLYSVRCQLLPVPSTTEPTPPQHVGKREEHFHANPARARSGLRLTKSANVSSTEQASFNRSSSCSWWMSPYCRTTPTRKTPKKGGWTCQCSWSPLSCSGYLCSQALWMFWRKLCWGSNHTEVRKGCKAWEVCEVCEVWARSNWMVDDFIKAPDVHSYLYTRGRTETLRASHVLLAYSFGVQCLNHSSIRTATQLDLQN